MNRNTKITLFVLILLVWIFYDVLFRNSDIHIQKDKKIMVNPNDKRQSACIKNMNDLTIYVYMFHYIIPDKFVDKNNKIEYGNSLSPEFFEKILKKLKVDVDENKIYITDFKALENFTANSCFPNKNIVLLTADDWWDDSYNYLFPLAKKYNMKFSLWIISSKVSKTNAEINNFANEYELRSMLDSWLIKIISHTYSHIDLRKQTDKTLDNELCSSKNSLESLFDIKINTIIYPSGKFDGNTLKYDKICWYKFWFTTKSWTIKIADLKQKPFELPRTRISRTTNISKIFNFN